MSAAPIDYDALAKQAGAVSSQPPVDYDALAKQSGAISSTSSASTTPTISAVPPPQGIRDKFARWSQNVMDDLRYGTDLTGVGTVLQKMGAHGFDVGVPEKVGEFMGSLPLGVLRATKGAAEVTQPGQFTQGAKDIGGGLLQAGEMPAMFTGSPEAGAIEEAAPGAIKAGASGAEALASAADMIPTAEKAGAKFSDVMSAASNLPLDVSAPGAIALRTKELADAGGTLPKVINDFLKRVTDPAKGPPTYAEGRDFYSNATRISADEAKRLTPVMKSQIAQFTAALNSSLEDVAEHAGKLDQYQQAMNEYHRAMQLRGFGEGLKSAATSSAAKAVGGGAVGGYLLRKLFE